MRQADRFKSEAVCVGSCLPQLINSTYFQANAGKISRI